MSKELFDSLLAKIGNLIKEYGVAENYAIEQKQSAGEIQYSTYILESDRGNEPKKGDVESIGILIQAFNKQQLITYNPNALNSSQSENHNNPSVNAKENYLDRFYSLITALEKIHRLGPNIPGIKYLYAPRYSLLQKFCENLANTSKNLWLNEKEKILVAARAQLEEERKRSQQQHEQFTNTIASEKEQRRKEKEEKRKKEFAELTAQLKQELLKTLTEKTAEDKPKLIADYEAKIALLESTQQRLIEDMAAKDLQIADLTAINETLNQTLQGHDVSLAPHSALRRSPTQAPIGSKHRPDFANASFFQGGNSEEKELKELQRRIGTIHATYVRCLAKLAKLADESALANKAKEFLLQLLVHYEQPITPGTTASFNTIALKNTANQEMVNKCLEEMAFLEKNDTVEKHNATIEEFHNAEIEKIKDKPMLTPQLQLLGKIKDFVMGYDDGRNKKLASQMIGSIRELNLALEERLTALRTERKKQQAQQSATAAALSSHTLQKK